MERYVGIFLSFIGIMSIFVEISKIKFNPWKGILGFVGRALNSDVKKELDSIQGILKGHGEYLKDIEMLVDMNEIKRIRAEIFSFADSCKLGVKHTEDAFCHIMDIHDDYKELLSKYDMANGRISVEYEYILNVYKDCVENRRF